MSFASPEDIIREYSAAPDALDNAVIHIAWYHCPPYEGHSFVLFEKDGKLYEVNGSHCSCSSLKGQWKPEETSWAALELRIKHWEELKVPVQFADEDYKVLIDLVNQHQN